MVQLDERSATRRLLDRFGFGPLPGEPAAGFDATLDALLAAGPDPTATPPPPLAPIARAPRRDSDARADERADARQQQAQLTAWWLDRMSTTRAPLPERLTWFWHGHFATSAKKVREPAALLTQNETFRSLGTGSFRTLAHAMILDPALMVWLDAQKNVVGAPNENLAREFMELFALGVGHYSETDVREAARALTGYRIDRGGGDTVGLVGTRQDTGPKTVLGVTGPLDAPGFVDRVLDQPQSQRFVARRLWFRLVSPTPPPPDVMDTLVAAYGPGTDLHALLRAIATSAPFRDSATTLVKQPVEWLVGLMRAVGVRASAIGAGQRDPLTTGLTALGQVPFLPPSVGGWPAGAAWLTPSAGLTRLDLARAVVARAPIPPAPTTPNARLEWARGVLGVPAWSPRTLDALTAVAAEPDPRQVLTVAALSPEYVVST